MKRIRIFNGILCLILCNVLLAEPEARVQRLTLNNRSVYAIPVSRDRVTSIAFPGKITALDGAMVTQSAGGNGLFELAFTPGSFFFSIRALRSGASSNINVVYAGSTYVLELHESAQAVLSVTFTEPRAAFSGRRGMRGRNERATVSPTILIGLLDKAKAFAVLEEFHPEALVEVQRRAASEVTDYRVFTVTVDEVLRFPPHDTLVFSVRLRNLTDQPIYYDRRSFSVRVGQRLYRQSISDAAGVIPPNREMPAYFAITGTPTGGRNDLSIQNQFLVLVNRVAQAPAKDQQE